MSEHLQHFEFLQYKTLDPYDGKRGTQSIIPLLKVTNIVYGRFLSKSIHTEAPYTCIAGYVRRKYRYNLYRSDLQHFKLITKCALHVK